MKTSFIVTTFTTILLAAGMAATAATIDFTGIDMAAVASVSGQDFTYTNGTGPTTGTVNVLQITGTPSSLVTGSTPDATGFYVLQYGGGDPMVFRFTFDTSRNFTITQNEYLANLEINSFTLPSGSWTVLSTADATTTGSGSNISFVGVNGDPPYGTYSIAGSGSSFDFAITNLAGYSLYGSAISVDVGSGAAVGPEVAIVPGTANPWLAGITTNGFQEAGGDVTPDESPVLFTNFNAGASLLFAASGSAGYMPGAESGPLGIAGYFVSHPAEDGIGEIDGSPANALIGVFLDSSWPDPSSTPTNVFDFSSDDSRSYLVLQPVLRQPFYIGSGTNASGVRQAVVAPANATRLYLGIQDGSGWYNNTGSFTVDVAGAGPLPAFSSVSVTPGPAPIRANNPWIFQATYSTLVSDLRLRVQSTLTTNSEASWTDLPGNPYMTDRDGTWTLIPTADVPTGDQYFRVIASAPGYLDRTSPIQGPFTVLSGIASLTDFTWQTVPPYRNNEPWTFSVGETSTVPGLGLRLQFSAMPTNETSWTDLAGGQMSTSNSVTWTATTSTLPLGTVFFRVIASANTYPDQISTDIGPFTIANGLGDFAPGDFQVLETGMPYRASNPWTFQAHFTNLVSGLRLRVQSTATTNSESSWTDLPGNPYMTMVDYNWTLNTTDIPYGTEWFRVVASAPGYVDSTAVAGPLDVLPGMAPLYNFAWHTFWPLQTGTNWVFTIDEASVISGLELRVQFSVTPTIESSWTDLPGGQMFQEPTNAVTWGVTNSGVPVGHQFFRVVASAPTYEDRISVPVGVIIGSSRPFVTKGYTSGKYALENVPETQNPVVAFFQNIGTAVVHFFFSSPAPKLQAHVVVGAPSGGSADLTVAPGQKVTAPAIAATTGGTLYVDGEINGDVSVISNDGGSIVAQDAGNVVPPGASYSVSQDAVVSNDGGSLTYGSSSGGGVFAKDPGPTQPTFIGLMTIDGNFDQYAGRLLIAIAGTNTLSQDAQQFDQLVVGGTASLLGGALVMGLFNPDNQTNLVGIFQPPVGATFDLVVASNLVVSSDYVVTGPILGSWSIVTRPDGLQALRLVVTSLPPLLTLERSGSLLQLSYPTNYTGFTVQSTPTLSAPNWTTFSTGTNVVTLYSPTNASRFFRLSKP